VLISCVWLQEGEGRDQKKKTRPPQRFFSLDKARDLRIPVESKRDNYGDAFEFINNLKFRDGYFFKTVSLESIVSALRNV
jgi:transcription elongation factor SPT5